MTLLLDLYAFVRYAKVNEPLTSCMIGSKIKMPNFEDHTITSESIRDSSSFFGQIGPVYLYNDAITGEQVQSIYSLGPSYMYSFLDNEALQLCGDKLPSGILDAKDGLASKIIFGFNAQVIMHFFIEDVYINQNLCSPDTNRFVLSSGKCW